MPCNYRQSREGERERGEWESTDKVKRAQIDAKCSITGTGRQDS